MRWGTDSRSGRPASVGTSPHQTIVPAPSFRPHGMLGSVPDDVRVNDRLTIPAAELSWRFSRSRGPGGQGVNPPDSRVELSWDLPGSEVPPPALRDRAVERLGDRLVRGVLT